MARMKKVDLIAKIAKEQKLDPKQLERLPMLELEKMDKVVPDSDGGDILGADPEAPVVVQDKIPDAPVKTPRVIGNHPVTGNPVYE